MCSFLGLVRAQYQPSLPFCPDNASPNSDFSSKSCIRGKAINLAQDPDYPIVWIVSHAHTLTTIGSPRSTITALKIYRAIFRRCTELVNCRSRIGCECTNA